MGADSPAENSQMPQKISEQNVCQKPKNRDFKLKLSLGVRSPWFEPIKASSVRLGRFGRYIV